MKKDEKILYKHYLKSNTKSRNEAIELLKNRDFNTLRRNYIHWFERRERVRKLNSTAISDVILALSKVKYKVNESEPTLSVRLEYEEGFFGISESESYIEIVSYIYTIVPFKKCRSLAKNCTSNALWKLKHQPNGRDAEACRKTILNNQ